MFYGVSVSVFVGVVGATVVVVIVLWCLLVLVLLLLLLSLLLLLLALLLVVVGKVWEHYFSFLKHLCCLEGQIKILLLC